MRRRHSCVCVQPPIRPPEDVLHADADAPRSHCRATCRASVASELPGRPCSQAGNTVQRTSTQRAPAGAGIGACAFWEVVAGSDRSICKLLSRIAAFDGDGIIRYRQAQGDGEDRHHQPPEKAVHSGLRDSDELGDSRRSNLELIRSPPSSADGRLMSSATLSVPLKPLFAAGVAREGLGCSASKLQSSRAADACCWRLISSARAAADPARRACAYNRIVV